jgi:hypothetical protein
MAATYEVVGNGILSMDATCEIVLREWDKRELNG